MKPNREAQPTYMQKWKFMLELQGDHREQFSWVAYHVGHLVQRVERLERENQILKGRLTRLRKRR